MDNTSAISLKDVYVNYEGITVLEDINLEVAPKEYLGIIGPNGGGKTTLLKTLLGLVRPALGKVLIFGKPPSQAHSYIGYVPQYTTFDREFPINVWDVVLMGRLGKISLIRSYSSKDNEIAEQALERVGMEDFKKRQIGRLSGGQLQKVLIARALTSQPKILLLDEPTSSIDVESETGLYGILGELNESMTIVLVSHDIGAISQRVKSIACLNRKLYHHGSKDLTPEVIEAVYGCPVDLIAHGAPHRVLDKHLHNGENHD
jgi:zinc transport system ATP-binding protein